MKRENLKITNAVIRSSRLTIFNPDLGPSFILDIETPDHPQAVFGGKVVCHKATQVGLLGQMVWRVFEICDCSSDSNIVDRAIRVAFDESKPEEILGIGHFMDDEWFFLSEDLDYQYLKDIVSSTMEPE